MIPHRIKLPYGVVDHVSKYLKGTVEISCFTDAGTDTFIKQAGNMRKCSDIAVNRNKIYVIPKEVTLKRISIYRTPYNKDKCKGENKLGTRNFLCFFSCNTAQTLYLCLLRTNLMVVSLSLILQKGITSYG